MNKEISRDYVKQMILNSNGDNISHTTKVVTNSYSAVQTHVDVKTNAGAAVEVAIVAVAAIAIT